MADSESRTQRNAALEEKRRKLEELKKRRSQRSSTEDAPTARVRASANLDEYIDGLLASSSADGTTEPSSKVPEKVEPENDVVTPTTSDAKSVESSTGNNVIAEAAPPAPPKVIETFTIGTQTEPEDLPQPNKDEDDVVSEEKITQEEAVMTDNEHMIEEQEKDPRILSPEELEKEVASRPFSSFLSNSAKKVERMLGASQIPDLLVDYIGENDDLDRNEYKENDADRLISSQQVFACQKWTSTRDITDLDWSSLHRELVLSTHHMSNSTNPSSTLSKGSAAVASISQKDTLSSSLTPRSGELLSDGLLLVWNLVMPSRPENIFTCGSPVTSGRFHPTEAKLVIGGCESGQMVVWDVRAGRLPVQKSALTSIVGSASKGHAFPIGNMHVLEGGSGLVSSSSDGRVNFWSLANLREPAESLQVGDSVSCMTVTPESESLLFGDEYGNLHAAVSSQSGKRRQVRKLESGDDSHYGMITSLSSKVLKKSSTSRVAGLSNGFLRGSGGLVLSAGVDWTVKLWSPAYSDKPLTSFVSHSYDYMSDVAWSPTHPSLFAAASSGGSLGLWNLANSLDDPMTGPEGIAIAERGRGLSNLKWSPDGRRLGVASGDTLYMLTLSDDAVRQKGDEDSKMMNQLMARGLISHQ